MLLWVAAQTVLLLRDFCVDWRSDAKRTAEDELLCDFCGLMLLFRDFVVGCHPDAKRNAEDEHLLLCYFCSNCIIVLHDYFFVAGAQMPSARSLGGVVRVTFHNATTLDVVNPRVTGDYFVTLICDVPPAGNVCCAACFVLV